ncbi:MAG: DUF6285 domain-containing protein [Stellaceae bacterium]|jgi:hypothetical protein
MRDLPEAPELLALARDVLVSELLPLLPPERQLDARLVANCMAIAEREATPDRTEWAEIVRELEALYHSAALTHPALPAGSPPSRIAGEGAECNEAGEREAGEGAAELLGQFAQRLRIGDFENSPERAAQARAILWRLTIAGLRLANPRFLAANGLS